MKLEFSEILHKIGALKFGNFKLTSGDFSPYYMDLRIIPSFPQSFLKICDYYIQLILDDIKKENFDRIAGIPTAGISFASIISYNLKIPCLYVRSTARQHGRGKSIEGVLSPGDRVLLLDDLITKGGSVIKAAEVVRAEGGQVNDAIVLVNREEGGEENLEFQNIKLHYLITTSELAKEMYKKSAISEKQLDQILKRVARKNS
jgi:orotate phosphoribosyltransferase